MTNLPESAASDEAQPALERLHAGGRADDTELTALSEAHRAELVGFLVRMTRDREAAEELLQDTFIRLIREGRAGRMPDEVRPWLYRVSTNAAISRSRHGAVWTRLVPRLLDRRARVAFPCQVLGKAIYVLVVVDVPERLRRKLRLAAQHGRKLFARLVRIGSRLDNSGVERRQRLRGRQAATHLDTLLLVLEEPPSLDGGEVTDKGSLNQGAILRRRHALVEELFAATPGARVIRAESLHEC